MTSRAPRRATGTAVGVHLGLALIAYVPVLTAAPGKVSADTKTYLYLDPGRLIARALTMWDPNVGMGTVTHQTIGYLFPLGPYYWAMERLGSPDWFAQRLWLASVLFAAGAGVLFLTRTLSWRGPGTVVAALVYMLSPYTLDYSARISVILLPWAALPWMVGLVDRALRRGGWRHPALFALTVTLVGGVNATALVLAGLGPALWVPFAVGVHRVATWRRATGTVLRIGALTTLASAWWLAGLWAQGAYGIEILRYTETVEAVTRTSLASEVLRGLGYWFFYGNDKLGPWIEPGGQFTQEVWLIAVGFALATASFLAAGLIRWTYRAYCVALVVVGTAIAVGAHPYDDPTFLGRLWKGFSTGSTVGLALRSTPRAVPLIVLGLALMLGAALTAIGRSQPRAAWALSAAAALLVAAGNPPLWTGHLPISRHLQRDEDIPAYWHAAARGLDGRGDDTRVLEVPGSDFAAYRWGNTVDPITPFLMDRPYVARELIPYGSPPSADLLNALDRRFQEGVFEPAALAPVSRLMGAGDIAVRSDLEFERYRTPRPRAMWRDIQAAPGLEPARSFGGSRPNRAGPQFPLLDEVELGLPRGADHPPPVATLGVVDPLPIVRTHPAAGGIVLAGDGEGVVDAAAAGLLDTNRALRYAASMSRRELAAELERGAAIVLTDTNRKRARRWGTVRENPGYTEPPGEHSPLRVDPADARLELFTDTGDTARTVAEPRGVRRVVATRYGNPVSYTAEDRPANALDGDERTAWRVGAFADIRGERFLVELDEGVTTDVISIVQPLTGPRNRFITRLEVTLDEREAFIVDLDETSRQTGGQLIRLPGSARFKTIELEIQEANFGPRARYDGLSGVGIAELGIGDVKIDEVTRLPTRVLRVAGEHASTSPLSVLLTRLRSNASEPVRADEEVNLVRELSLPEGRRFTIAGTARIAATVPDEAVDAMVGVASAAAGGLTARSSSRLSGSLGARASAAFDGDPATAWTPGFGPQAGNWVEVEMPGPVTVDKLDVTVVTDERHSLPRRFTVQNEAGETRVVDLPVFARTATDGATATATVAFEPIVGQRLRVVVDAVEPLTVTDYYSEGPIDVPVAIAELGIAGTQRPQPTGVDSSCRRDLVLVDGRPLPMRLVGGVEEAVSRRGVELVPCEEEPFDLGPGAHQVRTAKGADAGIDVDRLVLAAPAPAAGSSAQAPVPPGPRVLSTSRVGYRLTLDAADEPYWLVLGQSMNEGWTATAGGASLGPPKLLDGYANGWLIDPARLPGDLVVELEWAPQRWVWAALLLALVANLLCVAIVVGTGGSVLPGAMRAVPGLSIAGPRARRSQMSTALVVVGAGLLFTVAGGPVAGALVALGALLSAWPPGRYALRIAPAVCVAVAGMYTAVQQYRYKYPPDFAWPVNFERIHPIAWAAVGLLATLVVTERMRFAADGDDPAGPRE